MPEWLAAYWHWETLIALLMLTSMEIVLGIDNIVFIGILVDRLPKEEQARVRQIGLWCAMGMRILLLLSISWIIGLKEPLLPGEFWKWVTGKSLILIGGGLFLIFKATRELHHKIEGGGDDLGAAKVGRGQVMAILVQILLLDIIFSLDSVITAVGMVPPERIAIMMIAIVLSVLVMMVFAQYVIDLIGRHPTLKVLALSFLLLIGMTLVADGLGSHVEKGYVYFAMGFSVFVEAMNIRMGSKSKGQLSS